MTLALPVVEPDEETYWRTVEIREVYYLPKPFYLCY